MEVKGFKVVYRSADGQHEVDNITDVKPIINADINNLAIREWTRVVVAIVGEV